MAAFLSIGPALAQDATPVAEEAPAAAVAEDLRPWVVSDPFTPAPDECTVDALDVSSLATSLATPDSGRRGRSDRAGINRDGCDRPGRRGHHRWCDRYAHALLGVHQCRQPPGGGVADDPGSGFAVLRDRSLPFGCRARRRGGQFAGELGRPGSGHRGQHRRRADHRPIWAMAAPVRWCSTPIHL